MSLMTPPTPYTRAPSEPRTRVSHSTSAPRLDAAASRSPRLNAPYSARTTATFSRDIRRPVSPSGGASVRGTSTALPTSDAAGDVDVVREALDATRAAQP